MTFRRWRASAQRFDHSGSTVGTLQSGWQVLKPVKLAAQPRDLRLGPRQFRLLPFAVFTNFDQFLCVSAKFKLADDVSSQHPQRLLLHRASPTHGHPG